MFGLDFQLSMEIGPWNASTIILVGEHVYFILLITFFVAKGFSVYIYRGGYESDIRIFGSIYDPICFVRVINYPIGLICIYSDIQ